MKEKIYPEMEEDLTHTHTHTGWILRDDERLKDR